MNRTAPWIAAAALIAVTASAVALPAPHATAPLIPVPPEATKACPESSGPAHSSRRASERFPRGLARSERRGGNGVAQLAP